MAVESGKEMIPLLIERLLDWPFLLFVLLIVLFWRSRGDVFDLLTSRQIEVEVGGQKLKIGEAVEQLDQETDITREDLEALQQQIDTLKADRGAQPEAGDAPAVAPVPEMAEADDSDALEQLKKAIRDSKFTWRSVERLALEAGVEAPVAHRLLARDKQNIKLGLGRSGRQIARLMDE